MRLQEAMDIHIKMESILYPCTAFLAEKAKLIKRIIELEKSIKKLKYHDRNDEHDYPEK